MQLKINYKDESRVIWANRREDTYNSVFEMSMIEFFGNDWKNKVK